MSAWRMSAWSMTRRSIILGAIAALAVVLWQQLTSDEIQPGQVSLRQAVVPEVRTDNAAGPAASTDIQASRDLFTSVAPPPPKPVEPAAISAPQLVLVGTGLGPPTFAIVRSAAAGQSEKIIKGSKIAGWSVTDIQKNNVVISQSGSSWIIGFPPEQPRLCAERAC